MIKLLLVGH